MKLRSSELTFWWADGKLVVKTKKNKKQKKQNQKTPKTRKKKQKITPEVFQNNFGERLHPWNKYSVLRLHGRISLILDMLEKKKKKN